MVKCYGSTLQKHSYGGVAGEWKPCFDCMIPRIDRALSDGMRRVRLLYVDEQLPET